MSLEQLGRAAAQHLVDAIGGAPSPGIVAGAVKLVVRGSA